MFVWNKMIVEGTLSIEIMKNNISPKDGALFTILENQTLLQGPGRSYPFVNERYQQETLGTFQIVLREASFFVTHVAQMHVDGDFHSIHEEEVGAKRQPRNVQERAGNKIKRVKKEDAISRLTRRDLNIARKKLEENEKNNLECEIVVLENVDLAQYDKFMDKYEDHLRPAFICGYEDGNGKVLGKVVVQELPSEVHENCSGTIHQLIAKEICRAGDDFDLASSTLRFMNSPKYSLGNNRKEPDLAIKCKASNLLTLVVEVAWKNESLPKLREEVRLWKLHSDVRIIIGIKLFPSRRMTLFKSTRQEIGGWIETELEFGDDVGEPPNLTLEVRNLYYGSHIPAALAQVPIISISLSDLRNSILEVFP